MNIVELNPRPTSVDSSIVTLLENLLEMARAGDLRYVLTAAMDMDDNLWTEWSNIASRQEGIGAVEMLKLALWEGE